MAEQKHGNPSLLNPETVELPQHLIFAEIILRLPVKTLTRCKSVSKIWHSTISSPEFIKSHLTLSISNPFVPSNCVFVLRYDGPCFTLNYAACDRFPDDNHPEKSLILVEQNRLSKYHQLICCGDFHLLVGSCNGLVCSYVRHSSRNQFSESEYHFNVCNPSTSQCHCLVIDHTLNIRLGRLYGFGFVSSKDDYKLFVTSTERPSGKMCVHVYSLRSQKWKRVGAFDENERYLKLRTGRGTLVNETLHWGAMEISSSSNNYIFGFDLVDETFKDIPLPQVLTDSYLGGGKRRSLCVWSPWFRVCEIRESLCVWTDDVNGCVHMWMLKQYGVWDSWMKLFKTDRILGLVNFYGCTDDGEFLVKSRNYSGQSLLLAGLDGSPRKYNSLVDWDISLDVIGYAESLVSPFL